MHCGSLSKRGHQAEGRQQKDHWEAEQTLLLTRMGVEWNVISHSGKVEVEDEDRQKEDRKKKKTAKIKKMKTN